MELAFQTKPLRELCEKQEKADADFGRAISQVLRARLADLVSARSVAELPLGKPWRDGSGETMVVDLGEKLRLVFKANHVENPMTESNQVDWDRVTRIKILRIDRE